MSEVDDVKRALWMLHRAQDYILRTASTEIGQNSLAVDGASFLAWRLLRTKEDDLANRGRDA